jgi:hypothetical protein
MGSNKCVVPSRYAWIASEAVLLFHVDLPDELVARKNLYVVSEIVARSICRKRTYVAVYTSKATEFWRLNYGVAAVPDNHILAYPFNYWCDVVNTVTSTLRLVQVKMSPGAEEYPDFMSQGRTDSTEEGYEDGEKTSMSTPRGHTNDAEVADMSHVPGMRSAEGQFAWEAHPSHCE